VYTGILPCQKIGEMVANAEIAPVGILSDILADQVQPASIDLRLGDYAYPVDASFLPGSGAKVLDKMAELDPDFRSFGMDLRSGAVLEKGRVYVVPLLESIRLRSEVAPRSFSVVVRSGTRLNQLRFRRTRGEAPRPVTATDWRQLLSEGQISDSGEVSDRTGYLPFSIDLVGSGEDGCLIGWRAKKHTKRIDLDRRDYDPLDFWEPLYFHRRASLVLDPDEFYILMTKEPIAVPPDFAAEMLPYDTRAGEFRVHYAGFFDPGFGWDPATRRAGSSRGVLEVRSHEVPFVLEDGQRVGWLRYERMAERPHALYGREIGSHYQGQDLKLAKQFRPARL
jgi:dCTP deaminase